MSPQRHTSHHVAACPPHTGTEAMANTLITPPELDDDQTLESSRTVPDLGRPKELEASANPFQSLVQNFRDAFFPEKLPPLELESRPIAVKDPMAVKRDPVSTAVAVGFHALVLLLIIWMSAKAIKTIVAPPKAASTTSRQRRKALRRSSLSSRRLCRPWRRPRSSRSWPWNRQSSPILATR